jgi:predicted RNA-binding Zn ribbon-like protein
MKRARAPGQLELVQSFINTVDIEEGRDELHDREALAAWLLERGLIESSRQVSDADLRLVVRVREALRALAAANNGAAPDPRAAGRLNRVAERARLAVQFEGQGGARLEPRLRGAQGALGRLLGVVYTAMVDGSWRRLKACRSDSCRWVYYDRSKNRSSTWCEMAVCGNREKARSYRRRRRED